MSFAVVFVTEREADFESLFKRYLDIAGRESRGMPEILRTETGKPYFMHGDIKFSVSYSGGFKLTAFCDTEIGVDTERHKDIDFKRLSRRFFECEVSCQKEFFNLFTKKEASVKLYGSTLAKEISKPPYILSKNYEILEGYAVAVAGDAEEVFFVLS